MLRITNKGGDEVARRTYRLGIRLRSVLLLLSKPQSIAFVLQKSAFPPDQVLAAIDTLTKEGFIVSVEVSQPESVEAVEPYAPYHAQSMFPSEPTGHGSPTTPPNLPTPDEWLLDPAAVLSETKFLLVDFCVDCFCMLSEKLAEDIRACQSIGELCKPLPELIAMTSTQEPDRLAALREVIRKANETARLTVRNSKPQFNAELIRMTNHEIAPLPADEEKTSGTPRGNVEDSRGRARDGTE